MTQPGAISFLNKLGSLGSVRVPEHPAAIGSGGFPRKHAPEFLSQLLPLLLMAFNLLPLGESMPRLDIMLPGSLGTVGDLPTAEVVDATPDPPYNKRQAYDKDGEQSKFY